MKVKILALIIAVLLATLVFSGCLEDKKKTSVVETKTIYVDDSGGKDYTSIQNAIDNATDGYTVYVYSGTYYENILIDKSVILIGEEKNNTIIIGQQNENVILVSADDASIINFTIDKSQYIPLNTGIELRSNHIILENNIITNTSFGLYLNTSHNNYIVNNNFLANQYAIFGTQSTNNQVLDNNITNSLSYGIKFNESADNVISENEFNNNDGGIWLQPSSNRNKIQDNVIRSNSDHYCIQIQHSNENIIQNNNISSIGVIILISSSDENFIIENNINSDDNFWYCIFLDKAEKNTITGNQIAFGGIGILCNDNSNNNSIHYNSIKGCRREGISIAESYYNYISNNNLVNNTKNGFDGYGSSSNTWYNSFLNKGNYWDDYIGTDLDGDGIGDTPYAIEGGDNQDIYPLMNPVEI